MIKMNTYIKKALINKYIADFDAEMVNLTNLVYNSVGIGDHTDIVGEADKIVEKIADTYDKLSIVDVDGSVRNDLRKNITWLWEEKND